MVAYENVVSISERSSKRELTRRSKRDQLEVDLSRALEQFAVGGSNCEAKLRELSQEIINRCPLLQVDHKASVGADDIQLHLSYLINRRLERPPSSAALARRRPEVGRPRLLQRGPSAAQGRTSTRPRDANQAAGDVYGWLLSLESLATPDEATNSDLDDFLAALDLHLAQAEEPARDPAGSTRTPIGEQLEIQLEGLYGDEAERKQSIGRLRRLGRDSNEALWAISSNRLLLSALLRTLRDSSSRHGYISEAILFLLLRLTAFEDVHWRGVLGWASVDEPMDLLRILVDLVEEQSRGLNKLNDLQSILGQFHYSNALLFLLLNLLHLDQSGLVQVGQSQQRQATKLRLVQQYGQRIADSLIGLLAVCAKFLSMDLRRQPSSRLGARLTVILDATVQALSHFVIFKEFVSRIRGPKSAQPLVEFLTSLLNTLQLSRPGSGQQLDQQLLVRDQSTLNEIYLLEVALLRLTNNLLFEPKLRARLTKKNLTLKCVLRNLVVFLASRRSNSLQPFSRSAVLLVPLKCLHELSCSSQIRDELFKSKIIIKCLFEYLLSSATDLKGSLAELLAGAANKSAATKNIATTRDQTEPEAQSGPARGARLREPDQDQEQVVLLEPSDASHYIVGLWLNLSAQRAAPFYQSTELELTEPLVDYIELSLGNLHTFLRLSSLLAERSGAKQIPKQQQLSLKEIHLMIYIHSKLLRNLTQFLDFKSTGGPSLETYSKWMERLAEAAVETLQATTSGRRPEVGPICVEALATLRNLLMISSIIERQEPIGKQLNDRLLEMLFCQTHYHQQAENDDLLLVAINLLGTLATSCELCPNFSAASESKLGQKVIETISFVLDAKCSDFEMLISCLFTLKKLANHSSFLVQLVPTDAEDQQQVATDPGRLIDRLCLLLVHGDVQVVKLATGILNSLKQFEEQQSLQDSIISRQRFVHYNNRWLGAIRANREDLTGGRGERQLEVADFRLAGDEDLEEEDLEDGEGQLSLLGGNEISQLRAFNSSAKPQVVADLRKRSKEGQLSDEEEEEEEEDEEEEEGGSSSGEPDLNVIDANSMIRHLTDRKEFRSELLRR